jgi:NADH:ubiquinone oxidoreductase subunit
LDRAGRTASVAPYDRWSEAALVDDLGCSAWRHRTITLNLAPGEHEILVRAWDSSAATQPEDEAALWNPKGYVNNARPRITVRAVASEATVQANARAAPRLRRNPERRTSALVAPAGHEAHRRTI